MKIKTILYIGNFSFPFGNAAGKRVYANGKIFKELGYEVVFVGLDNNLGSNTILEKTEKIYDGFKYYNFSYPKNNLAWINYNMVFRTLIEFIDKKIHVNNIGMIIYYGSLSMSLFVNKLIKYSRNNNIKIISDCVDWLTVKTNNPIFNLIKWADNTYQKSYLNKEADGVIVISKYLDEYYSKRGLKTVIIPPLSPVNYEYVEGINQNHKKIVYAGIPFRKGRIIKDLNTLKDRIDKTIILLFKAKEKEANFIFNVYGFTEDEYLEVIPSQKIYIDGLGDSIVFHGVKPNDEVTKEISKADFTILIRDVNRDTTAGFPTKISESISCGTPVITTKTSDLEDYIVEGENGFFISEDEYDAIDHMSSIIQLSLKEVNEMKLRCYEMQMFSYKNYQDRMEVFLNNIMH